MSNIRFGFIVLIIALLFSCNECPDTTAEQQKVPSKGDTSVIESDEGDIIGINDPPVPMEELKKRVRKGDIEAYGYLHTANLCSPEDHIFWALFMANKYDFPQAYADVYFFLMDSYRCQDYRLEKMDVGSRRLALEYLKLAAEKGHVQANEIIKEYFPELKVK